LKEAKFVLFLRSILLKMLQRKQSFWMFLAVLSAVALFAVSQNILFFGKIPVVKMVGIALILIGFFSIFSFKNRKRQMLLNRISIFINALLIGLLLYGLLNLSGGKNFPEKGIEPIFPFLAIICLLIANRFIRRDERLVKSVDRLR
jgi:predicted membrane channel-forming protein YqfA (hemolysin III family)